MLVSLLGLVLLLMLAAVEPISGLEGGEAPLIDFSEADTHAWRPVNDGVMGGLSTSSLVLGENGTALFSGHLSLENNGGFASVRAPLDGRHLDGSDGLVLRVRGDGRSYQLRLRTDRNFDGVAYRSEFATSGEGWEILHLPFSEFLPSFRGRILRDVEALRPVALRQISFMIADKRQGEFRLEIDWVKAIRTGL